MSSHHEGPATPSAEVESSIIRGSRNQSEVKAMEKESNELVELSSCQHPGQKACPSPNDLNEECRTKDLFCMILSHLKLPAQDLSN